MSIDSLSTREAMLTLAAVIAKVGPVELTEREIEYAPALMIEVLEEGRCVLSVRGWCKADACPADVCGGPHASHTCSDGSIIVALPGAKCPQCGEELTL